MRPAIRPLTAAVVLAASTARLSAGEKCPDCRFFIEDGTLLAGATGVQVVARCDNSVVLFGYSIAIHWDNASIRMNDATRAGTVAEKADFFQGDFDQSRGLLGFGIVMDTSGSFEKVIEPGTAQPILVLGFDVTAENDTQTTFRFDDAQIEPPPRRPTQNLMTNNRGGSIVPALDDGLFTIETRRPEITGLRGNSGPAGTVFQVDGRFFDEGDLVVRVCDVEADAALRPDGVTIDVTAPDCPSGGCVDVEVCTVRGCDSELAGFCYEELPVPVIAAVEPAEGRAGDQIEIRGENFDEPGFVVQICGVAAEHGGPLDGGTRVLVVVPSCPDVGPAAVAVCNDFGCDSRPDGFTYLPPAVPSITSISPDQGVAATRVTISGSNFDQPGLVIRICDAVAAHDAPVEGGTQVDAIAPECDRTGAVHVEVCNQSGCALAPNGFTYLGEPVATITEITPNEGRAGDPFTVTGANFDQPGFLVRVCGVLAEHGDPRAGGTEVDVTAPECDLGPADVEVCNDFGCDTAAGGFTYVPNPVPRIDRVEPASGFAGDELLLFGENLDHPGLAVTICGVPAATGVPAGGGTRVLVTAPPCEGVGPVDVEVSTDFGCDTAASGFEYLPPPVPVISAVVPDAGQEGTVVAVRGERLDQPGLVVRICGVEAALVVPPESGSEVRVFAPACAAVGPADVEVCTSFGCATSAGGFTYLAEPSAVLAEVDPTHGLPGTELTITGVNFDQPDFAVRICGQTVDHGTVRDGGTRVVVVAPDCPSFGAAEVEVCNTFGCDSELAFTFLEHPLPVISEIVPASGMAGSRITIRGLFFDEARFSVRICGRLSAHDPPADDGRVVEVEVPPCATLGPADVQVSNEFGCAVREGGFVYLPPPLPEILEVSPREGIEGTVLAVRGRNFDQASLLVRVCGVRATHGAPSKDGTEISVVVPRCAVVGPVSVEVCSPFGCDLDPEGFTYLQGPVPELHALDPPAGSRGTVIRLEGTNFDQPGFRVRICGVFAAHDQPANGGTEVLVLAPPCGTVGPVDVEACNDFGCAVLEGGFTYEASPAPVITSISPVEGRAGDVVTLFGRNFDQPGFQVRICDVVALRRAVRDGGRAVELIVPRCGAVGRADVEVSNEFGSQRVEGGFLYLEPFPERFARGDADSSGEVELTDGIAVLGFLFNGRAPPRCMDAADADDNGAVEITDAIAVFNWLFLGGEVPPDPSPSAVRYLAGDCGLDPTDGDAFGCEVGAATCRGGA